MADRYDELVAIRQQAAHQRLVQGYENQRQANWHDYCQAIAENNMDAASWAEAEFKENTRKLLEATGQAQQQQAQQPQDQFTPMQREWIARNPSIWNDDRKRAEVLAAHELLMRNGKDPNSVEYIATIDRVANNPTTLEGELTPDVVCEICGIDADTYNRGVNELNTRKLLGHYRNDR